MLTRRNGLLIAAYTIFSVCLIQMNAEAEGTLLSGREIMDKVFTTRKLDGSEAVVTMTNYTAKGEKRLRKIAMATKLFDGGKTEKRVYRFIDPPDVKGTGVLAYDYETKPDDMWLYLPALRKTRRIVSSAKSKSFMGSEFSYADLNIPLLDEFTYKMMPDQKVDGVDCYAIEVLPKTKEIAEDEQYSKKTIWVAKQDYTIRKAQYFDLQGKLLKELTSKNIKLIDQKNKRYRSMYMEMTNKQTGNRSVFECEKIELKPDTKDEYFETAYLERP